MRTLFSLLAIVLLSTSCTGTVARWETLTGYAFESGPIEDGSTTAMRIVFDKPIGDDSKWSIGSTWEGNFGLTPDAIPDRNAAMFNLGLDAGLRVSYDFDEDTTLYGGLGWGWTSFKSEGHHVNTQDDNVSVRFGVRWDGWLFEYQGMPQEFDIKTLISVGGRSHKSGDRGGPPLGPIIVDEEADGWVSRFIVGKSIPF